MPLSHPGDSHCCSSQLSVARTWQWYTLFRELLIGQQPGAVCPGEIPDKAGQLPGLGPKRLHEQGDRGGVVPSDAPKSLGFRRRLPHRLLLGPAHTAALQVRVRVEVDFPHQQRLRIGSSEARQGVQRQALAPKRRAIVNASTCRSVAGVAVRRHWH